MKNSIITLNVYFARAWDSMEITGFGTKHFFNH